MSLYWRVDIVSGRVAPRPEPRPTNPMPKSVLIADDQESVRRILRTALESAGFMVCAEASDGLDALEKATRFSPDLIVLDLRMPKMSGVEAAAALRNRLPTTPIVLLTMYGAIPAMAAAVGVTIVIDKSDGATSLVDCVRKLLTDPHVESVESPAQDPPAVNSSPAGRS